MSLRPFQYSLRRNNNVAPDIMNSLLTKSPADDVSNNAESVSVLVAYEDSTTRDRAMQTCDRLVQRFWKDLEFDFSWWRFDFLGDRGIVEAASNAAAHSDLILISAHAGRQLPSSVQTWIESWTPRSELQGGVLVAMIGTSDDPLKGLTPIHVYLREAAQQSNMDYLSQLGAPSLELDNTLETIAKRAEKVTSLLDNILHRPQPSPSCWGINE